ncbi:adenylate/guanylate cyclase domain-containing protein [Sphingomonas mesophila]|uniref:adenylate/guanylate cyclase domain-containing protein n=1 Tax=Sphingomonas mesophila TaxID=2303576 RepID=UPI000E5785F0|nr:adenylate/guanylate cyclase domain-containing protein [Sphingomonas mesophila]
MQRRLAAILAADVVGYSRLMGANEVATLEALKALRRELLDPCIAEHSGRTVKLTGDGTLVEFPSVVGALDCAVEIQRDMRARQGDVPDDRRIEFRMGIHLGDVIVDDDDLYGDGVNVASRLEAVAKPGGVAVSASVRDNVGTRSDVEFTDAGLQTLKNIETPVQVYHIAIGSGRSRSAGKDSAPAADERPSIAVLPFNNMSDDPGQEFFSDGITEDIITDLSKVSGLFVVGRNTSFTYKGKAVQLQQVAAELGTRFILEGSVRKAGERVRVNAQLIDGASGGHVWADRYDRDLTDIFAIQDEITQAIVGELKIKLLPQEKKAITQAPTANVEAYTYYLKGRQFFFNSTRILLRLARQMFAKAVEIDPNYARAYAGMAICDARLENWYRDVIDTDSILAAADKAIALDPNLSEAHVARGVALSNRGDVAGATASFDRALAADPNSFDANLAYARFHVTQGNLDASVPLFERAVDLNPEDWQSPMLVDSVLMALDRQADAERYARIGIKRAEEALRLHPENSRPAQLGAPTLARIGEREKAIDWLERAMFIDPEDPIVSYNAACTYTQLGEVDKAFAALEKWAANSGSEMEMWLQTDSDFDVIRADPRFIDLTERLKERRAAA